MAGSAVVFPRWTSDSEISFVSLWETLFWFLFVGFLSWAWGTSAKIFWRWLAQPISQDENGKDRRESKEEIEESSKDVPKNKLCKGSPSVVPFILNIIIKYLSKYVVSTWERLFRCNGNFSVAENFFWAALFGLFAFSCRVNNTVYSDNSWGNVGTPRSFDLLFCYKHSQLVTQPTSVLLIATESFIRNSDVLYIILYMCDVTI
jgi:hypothetical protein